MAEAEKKIVGNHAIPQMSNHQRDLSPIIIPGKTHFPRTFDEVGGEDDGEIELSLGLSSNGRFGVDPKRAKTTLVRSSSVSSGCVFANSSNIINEMGARVEQPQAHAPLGRTCSLPTATEAEVETEEERRQRKEIQTMRRMEARQKRLQKMRNAARNNNNGEDNGGGSRSSQGSDCRSSQPTAGGGGGVGEGLPPIPSPQGSAGGSSGNTESGRRSPGGIRTPPKHNEQKRLVSLKSVTEKALELVGAPSSVNNNHRSTNAATIKSNGTKEISRDEVANLPCVYTRGVGPNGKDIEGFLYGYRKGEEVKIVCVCHGLFHSPAEFVRHAGGEDVPNPLKHIVVSSSSLL